MKYLLLVPILLLLTINTCQAQDTDFKKPMVHAGKQSYNVGELSLHYKYVRNINNYITKGPNIPEHAVHPMLSDRRYDNAHVAQIFYDIFPEVRLKKLADEDLDLQVNYNLDLQGNVIEISFGFADTSSLTPIEIEELETRLKKEVKFTLNDKVYKGYDYVPHFVGVVTIGVRKI